MLTPPTLADVLARRGRLAPPEVVTLLAPLAADLAEWHTRGDAHGQISPDAVTFDPGGRAHLAAAAPGHTWSLVQAQVVAPEVACGGRAAPPADVFSLAALGWWALVGTPPWAASETPRAVVKAAAGERPSLAHLVPEVPPALVATLERALRHNPEERPEADRFAAEILAACPAAPLGLGAPRLAAPPSTGPVIAPSPRRSRLHGGRAAGAAALVVVAVMVVLGWPAAPHDQQPAVQNRAVQPLAGSPPRSVTTATLPIWPAVLARLAADRVRALTMRDVARLDDVYAATSSLAVRDRALVQLLTREGWHLRGRLAVLDQPGAVRTTATGADLRAVEEPAAYDVVDAHGRLVRAVRRARPRAVALHLVRTGRGWRLMAVTAVQVRA